MVRKHTQDCPVPLIPITVDLQVILNEVLGKYKILPGPNKIISWNSAHTIPSFRVFVINIIKMNLDWKNCHHFQCMCIHPENAGVSPPLPASCTPEGVSELLMKFAPILHSFSLNCSGFLFSI